MTSSRLASQHHTPSTATSSSVHSSSTTSLKPSPDLIRPSTRSSRNLNTDCSRSSATGASLANAIDKSTPQASVRVNTIRQKRQDSFTFSPTFASSSHLGTTSTANADQTLILACRQARAQAPAPAPASNSQSSSSVKTLGAPPGLGPPASSPLFVAPPSSTTNHSFLGLSSIPGLPPPFGIYFDGRNHYATAPFGTAEHPLPPLKSEPNNAPNPSATLSAMPYAGVIQHASAMNGTSKTDTSEDKAKSISTTNATSNYPAPQHTLMIAPASTMGQDWQPFAAAAAPFGSSASTTTTTTHEYVYDPETHLPVKPPPGLPYPIIPVCSPSEHSRPPQASSFADSTPTVPMLIDVTPPAVAAEHVLPLHRNSAPTVSGHFDFIVEPPRACDVRNCPNPTFCELSPCRCKICREHLGSIIRAARFIEADEVDKRAKRYRCLSCQTESFTLSSKDEQSRDGETVTASEMDTGAAGVSDDQTFSIHYMTSIASSNQSNSTAYDYAAHTLPQAAYPSPYTYPYYSTTMPVAHYDVFPNHVARSQSTTAEYQSQAGGVAPIMVQGSDFAPSTAYPPVPSIPSLPPVPAPPIPFPHPYAFSAYLPTLPYPPPQAYSLFGQSDGISAAFDMTQHGSRGSSLPSRPQGSAQVGVGRHSRSYSASAVNPYAPLSYMSSPYQQRGMSVDEGMPGYVATTIRPTARGSFTGEPITRRSRRGEYAHRKDSVATTVVAELGDGEETTGTPAEMRSAWRVHKPAFPIIKLENLPFATTVEHLEGWLPEDSLAPKDDSRLLLAVHLILHRETGRTLPHAYLEMRDIQIANEVIASLDRKQFGDRKVRAKWERRGEMLRDLFTQEGYFAAPSSSPASAPLPPAPTHYVLPQTILSRKDLGLIVHWAENSVIDHRERPIERAFLSVVTIIAKFPWTHLELYTKPQRNAIFDSAFDVLVIAMRRLERGEEEFVKIVEKVRNAILTCIGFTDEQKHVIRALEAELPVEGFKRTPIVTPSSPTRPPRSISIGAPPSPPHQSFDQRRSTPGRFKKLEDVEMTSETGAATQKLDSSETLGVPVDSFVTAPHTPPPTPPRQPSSELPKQELSQRTKIVGWTKSVYTDDTKIDRHCTR